MTTALVTGANRGIGLELCRQLKERGYEVVAACRNASPELSSIGIEIAEGVDVTDIGTLDALAARLRGRRIDLLVNNAGILETDSLDRLDAERMVRQFEVNSIGPLLVTRALRSSLATGSRVAIISSRVGSLADNSSGGYYGYRMSKAAANMAGVNLAHDLRKDGVVVLLMHPGMVATAMTGGRGIPPEESARGLITRIEAATLEDSGSFRHANGESLPW
jgi:NAD(P)-dependent dehydrogenase (short-subunit alcohol dehydrogenase family)